MGTSLEGCEKTLLGYEIVCSYYDCKEGILDIAMTCFIPMYFPTNLLTYWTILLSRTA